MDQGRKRVQKYACIPICWSTPLLSSQWDCVVYLGEGQEGEWQMPGLIQHFIPSDLGQLMASCYDGGCSRFPVLRRDCEP